MEAKDPTLPIDSTEPREPMDSTESREPMDSRLLCDFDDHREPAAFISPACQAPASLAHIGDHPGARRREVAEGQLLAGSLTGAVTRL